MKKIELLSPAGSMESLYAAVQNGADAVYFGGDKFSARAYAGNFNSEDVVKAIEYCHLYGVKAYITLNTLIKECEFNEIQSYLEFLYINGADALIVQDLGIAQIVLKSFPDFEIHASTQMTIHNGEGAKLLNTLGFKRIVLSRELSLKEIQYISRELNIETEIFVHGALCICYSGQCLMSSMIGGRSGNRGRCAQPCRLPYGLINKQGKKKNGYLLSPKDICLIDDIKKIINSGTASLKIEGRMKRPEYVAGVTSIYREVIDDVYAGKNDKSKQEKLNKNLLQLFNREGFSKAYMFGNKGSSMMAYTNPKNTGVPLGTVDKDGNILLLEEVKIKDGISADGKGCIVSKILKNNTEIEKGNRGEKVRLYPKCYKNNDVIFKTQDLLLLNSCKNSFSDVFRKKIQLECEIKFQVGKNMEIIVDYMDHKFKTKGSIVEKPIKAPISMDKIINNIKKAGDTPFIIEKVNFNKFEEGYLPISSINEIRRNVVSEISEFVINKYKRKKQNNSICITSIQKDFNMPKTLISVANKQQLDTVIKCGYNSIAINPFAKNNILNTALEYKNIDLYLKIPNIIREEFENVCSIIEKNRNTIKGLLTGNMGIINRYKGTIPIIGDYKLNIYNKLSWEFYSNIIEAGYISVELNKTEIKDVFKNLNLPLGILLYGSIELMVSEYCPVGALFGGRLDEKKCDRSCEKSTYILKDRKEEEYNILTDKFCRSYIYNNVPINLIPNIDEIKNIGINSFRLDFLFESQEETENILNFYKNEKWTEDFSGYTRGHFKRGVE